MRIRVLGGGVYGTHLSLALLADHHAVELHEISDRLFAGASGNMPARGHRGFHYPRSKLTRDACQAHVAEFEARYGHLTHGVAVNLYAIAAHDSLIDFGTYKQVLQGHVEFITVERPDELGLANIEGALLTGERHLVVDKAREYFTKALDGHVQFLQPRGIVDDPRWDVSIDTTFCSFDETNIDRYEPCLTVLLDGPIDRAVTIVDGQFPSLFPWNEERGLSSLTSAKFTPFCKRWTWKDAKVFLDGLSAHAIAERTEQMVAQMAHYYPRIRDEYRVAGHLLAIRAMPRSAADARLVDVIRVGERGIRVRAGKLDAIFAAEKIVKDMIRDGRRAMKQAMVA